MSVYLIGEFHEKESVRAAILALRACGLDPGELDLFSGEPVEFPRSVLDRPSRMSLAAGIGAVGLGGLATAFVAWTQHNYGLVTGGMPLFSWWATGVITYEMVMLGAILTTFLWFLRESGLGWKRGRSAPIPHVKPGSICLRVCCRLEQAAGITEMMRKAGANPIERGDP
jgi:hypothetical protein